ncbi:hypothetical protein VH12019_00108 [Vibrio phage VH1_2019]|uniref:Uncharacterized protein n=1 Tax=Vibrio phage VH1_2019 TaxID=2686307 RepID=A0A6B9STB8_9CAUD|nr:hypothetical protein VH12019_00108 [Vibrio phage VH1_2019]
MNPSNREMTGFNNISRTGKLKLQADADNVRAMCMDVVRLLNSKNIPSNFDINHNDGGNIGVHEWVSQIRFIHLKYMNVNFQTKIFKHAYHNTENVVDYFDTFKHSDKYHLSAKPRFLEYENVVFLCGSNVLEVAIDFDKIDALVEQYPDLVIKPHPITTLYYINMLKTRYGSNRVLSQKISGVDVLKSAKRVWLPSTSEFWFSALNYDKEIGFISKDGFCGTYTSIINAVWELHEETGEPLKDIVNKIISSPYSGLYGSMADFEEHHEKYCNVILELGGNFDNV